MVSMSSEKQQFLPVVERDEWLQPVAEEIQCRYDEYQRIVRIAQSGMQSFD